MKKVKLFAILFFCFSFSFAQEMKKEKNILKDLSIEFGVGYGTLTHKYDDKTTLDNDTIYRRKEFWTQPTLRISYKILTCSINSYHFDFSPFVGYYIFGGKSETAPNGYKDILYFESIEFGLKTNISQNSHFEISPSIKAQYIFKTEQKYYGYLNQPDNVPREWMTQNNDDIFKSFAMSFGLNTKYKYKKLTFGIEGWYGISNLSTIGNDSIGILKIRENNYRILVGYEF
jgi:hypothetical protein